MYSKQEAVILKQQFWTGFGQYLAPVPAATGSRINWINYKTGVKHIHFKMDVTNQAYIAIEISHNDLELREIFFNHFDTLKSELELALEEKWTWEKTAFINGKQVSRIYITLNDMSIFRQADWPGIISFLKPRIIALDSFWTANRDIFEMLT